MLSSINNTTLDKVILYIILPYLDYKNIFNLSTTNKRFNKLCNNDFVWANLIKKRYINNNIELAKETYSLTTTKDVFKLFIHLDTMDETRYKNIEVIINRKDFVHARKALTEYPRALNYMRNLEELHLKSNKIKVIPNSIKYLTNLKKLTLFNNKLTEVSPEIKSLKNLTELDLSCNLLVSLPKEIGELEQLEKLNLCDNKMVVLPAFLGNLKSLQVLVANHNYNMETLEEGIFGPDKFVSLRELNVAFNDLKGLPEGISKLTNLRLLDISNNNMENYLEELNDMVDCDIQY